MVQATDNQAGEVFTLHERVSDRWEGGATIGAGVTVEPMVTGRIDGLIGSLPGLASLSGSFGAQAFDIASLLAMESRFSYALSPDLRAMSIGDLADIVQVVLEEEEVELEALHAQVRQAKTNKARATAMKRLKKAKSAHPKRAQMGQQRKVAAVRNAIAKVRAEAARVRAEIQRTSSPRTASASRDFVGGEPTETGAVPSPALGAAFTEDGGDEATGVSKTAALGTMGTTDPGMLPAIGESLQILRMQPALGQKSQRRQGFVAAGDVTVSAADLASNVTADHTASRALRLAEWTADMAVLQPATENAWGAPTPTTVAPDEAAQRETAQVGMSFEPSAMLPAVMDAYAELATPQMVPAEHRAALQRAQQVAAQRTVQKQQAQQRAAMTRTQTSGAPSARPKSAALMAQPAFAPRLAAMRRLAAAKSGAAGVPARGTTPRASTDLGAGAPAVAPLTAVGSTALASEATVTQHRPLSAASALTGAVQLSASTLGRHAAGLDGLRFQRGAQAALSRDGAAPAASEIAGVATRAAGLQPSDAAKSAIGSGLWDRFSALLTSPTTDAVGAMQGWVAASEAMLLGADSAPRFHDALGAGETLRITADAPVVADDVRAGAPAWIAPTTRRAAAQQLVRAAAQTPRAVDQAGLTPARRVAGPAAATLGQAAPSVGLARPVASAAQAAFASRTASETFASTGNSPMAALQAGVQQRTATSVLGGAAIGAFKLANELGARHFGGLLPGDTPAAWAPMAAAKPMTFTAPTLAPEPGSKEELTAIASLTGIPVESLTRMAPAAVAQMRGALADQAGAGEWLLPGDAGYDSWVTQQAEAGDRPTAVPPNSRAARRVAAEKAARSGEPAQAGSAQTAPVQTVSGQRLGATTNGAVPHAAAAAIKQVVALHDRAAQREAFVAKVAAAMTTGSATRSVHAERSLMAFARGGIDTLTASALGALPGGLSDAITPWILQRAVDRLAPEVRERLMMTSEGTGDLLSLDTPEAVGAAPKAAVTVPTTTARPTPSLFDTAAAPETTTATAATRSASLSPAHQSLLQRMSTQGGAGSQSLLGGAALDLREPSALRAALALFGEQPATGGGAADAFLSRFFGRAAPTPARSDVAEMTPLAAGAIQGAASADVGVVTGAIGAAGAAAAATADDAADKQVVFSGLAGLQALREMKGAGVAETDLLDLGVTESVTAGTSPQKGAKSSARSASQSGAVNAAKAPKSAGGTAAKIHRFAPTGLARTRQLLEGRRGAGRVSTRRSRFGRGRVGYGAAGLGGGALLGLMPGDTGGFDEGYSGTGASRRAERLGAAVQARRAPRPGQVLRPMPEGGSERTYVSNATSGTPSAVARSSRGGYVGSAAAGFGGGGEFVSPTAAMQTAASSTSSGGASAGIKNQQASAMARVLSVTAAPSANVLPLVAPAARAVVAQAAAKPMSESIATSGANPTASVQMGGQAVSGEQAGGSGMGAGAQDRQDAGGQPTQELNALAMKVARSVLVRIKRERERRGIYG